MEEKVIKQINGTKANEVVGAIIEILDEREARDVKVMKVSDKTVLTEYFVICTGTSNTQRRAYSNFIEEGLKARGVTPSRIEGYEDDASWIVLDYFNVIVHIFDREARDFYKLEKLWSGANEVSFNSVGGEK